MTLYQKVNLNADVVAKRKTYQQMMKKHYKIEEEKEWLSAMEKSTVNPKAYGIILVALLILGGFADGLFL